MKAIRSATLPFPDGTILVKLHWKRVPSSDLPPASAPDETPTVLFDPGAPTVLQFMVRDSKKYAATGGWGFGVFRNGKPGSVAEHETCFACHQAYVKDQDLVFTRFAP